MYIMYYYTSLLDLVIDNFLFIHLLAFSIIIFFIHLFISDIINTHPPLHEHNADRMVPLSIASAVVLSIIHNL